MGLCRSRLTERRCCEDALTTATSSSAATSAHINSYLIERCLADAPAAAADGGAAAAALDSNDVSDDDDQTDSAPSCTAPQPPQVSNIRYCTTHVSRDYPGEPVPER